MNQLSLETIYWIIFYFIVYSVLGWCTEVAYAAIHHGKIVNRGFLNGPVCPIYGFGMVIAIGLLSPLIDSAPALFFGGMLLTSTVELIGGYVLYKAYHMRWWDYTKCPYNIGGYVCLEFSIYWGIGVVLVMRVVHPTVTLLISLIPTLIGWIVLGIVCAFYMADLIVTLKTVSGLKKDLSRLEEMAAELKNISNRMTDEIGNRALTTGQKIGEAKVQSALAKAEWKDETQRRIRQTGEELTEARNKLEKTREEIFRSAADKSGLHGVFGSRRLLLAFPGLHSDMHADALKKLQERSRNSGNDEKKDDGQA